MQTFDGKQEVTVTDIKMPFWSMVTFMLKWVIATIPAMFILAFAWIGFIVIGLFILGALGITAQSLQGLTK